jgi:hypothetical protein
MIESVEHNSGNTDRLAYHHGTIPVRTMASKTNTFALINNLVPLHRPVALYQSHDLFRGCAYNILPE